MQIKSGYLAILAMKNIKKHGCARILCVYGGVGGGSSLQICDHHCCGRAVELEEGETLRKGLLCDVLLTEEKPLLTVV